ncbi:phosphonopyruvate decarboxylase [Desulfatibacillum aliphaticivorans]|uniref:Phosphonopyruvate decarboxylase n=1 Tax=Desulfatibacillum aliphaticivorans TaxID=218208 RepID=B8F9S7_DESAL|nr:phosphonopyruvate decarboxylase [Desulfatibacillum aliphaticivorans]ACL03023.1 phosphonopyruvate decarboxylase [Desulfatibacillum aliphaticivorans]
MQKPSKLFDALRSEGISFFTGVPDSLLKYFCAYITDNTSEGNNVITANEGNAIALAAGRYIGSGQPAAVYMQNSGIGNAVNPLLSLADREVYSVPMMLIIGWRGEPGMHDEPQHVKQGRTMLGLLDVMGIPYTIIDAETVGLAMVVNKAATKMRELSAPVALVIRKGTFEPYRLSKDAGSGGQLSREAAIKSIAAGLNENEVIVSTTGMASRELYEFRQSTGNNGSRDFLTVGSMGHTSSIAMGVAMAQTGKKVVCIDGDGSALMHMGALGIVGNSGLKNLLHIVLNNGAHDSVGGQPTVGQRVDFVRIASACGYVCADCVHTTGEVETAMKKLVADPGPGFLEIRVKKGARPDIGRPKDSPVNNKKKLMDELGI